MVAAVMGLDASQPGLRIVRGLEGADLRQPSMRGDHHIERSRRPGNRQREPRALKHDSPRRHTTTSSRPAMCAAQRCTSSSRLTRRSREFAGVI
jgi:hypothetical protein